MRQNTVSPFDSTRCTSLSTVSFTEKVLLREISPGGAVSGNRPISSTPLLQIEDENLCLLTLLQYQFLGIGELQGVPVVENGPISCNGATRYVYVDCSARLDAKGRAFGAI